MRYSGRLSSTYPVTIPVSLDIKSDEVDMAEDGVSAKGAAVQRSLLPHHYKTVKIDLDIHT